jgi:hypothetical protein
LETGPDSAHICKENATVPGANDQWMKNGPPKTVTVPQLMLRVQIRKLKKRIIIKLYQGLAYQ